MPTDALPRAVQGRLDAHMALLNAAPACSHALTNGRGMLDDWGRAHCADCIHVAWWPLMAREGRP